MKKARAARESMVIAVVVALVLGVVYAAVQAEGQRTIRPDTHDGGAWLVNASEGAIGHVNRSVAEISGAIVIAQPGDSIDTEQSGQTVLVNNRSSRILTLIDARTYQKRNEVVVPAGVEIALAGDDAVLWTSSPLRVWRLSLTRLAEIRDLGEDAPLVEREGDGLLVVDRFGTILATEAGSTEVFRHRTGGRLESLEQIDAPELNGDVAALGGSGTDGLLLTTTGALFVLRDDAQSLSAPIPLGNIVSLAQPSLPNEPVIALGSDNTIFSIDLAAGERVAASVGAFSGSVPVRPIFHAGCTYVLATDPVTLTIACDGATALERPISASNRDSLRLRLINGHVWVNDLRTGDLWLVDESQELDRIDDWGAALSNEEGDGEETDDAGDDATEQRENPDADDAAIIRADEIDEDDENEPPVARDDTAATRVDTPVLVDVLLNDEDPDGDVILVSDVTTGPEGSAVVVTGDRQQIQITPRPGDLRPVDVTYTITDGRGGVASADIRVTIIDPLTNKNQAPIATTDVVTARAGASAAVNVLLNDSDPDGDPILLVAVDAEIGSVSFDDAGQVTYVPDAASDERTIDIGYTVADSFGATAEGTLRVGIRLDDSNTPPDARNDSATTTAGQPVTINVLRNDTDPDGDSISIAAEPELLAPTDATPQIDLSPDGQLFFLAEQPGDYLIRYTIIDAQQQDAALIRVIVDESEVNRPPIAVIDELVGARGEVVTAYILNNDFDPDGDVLSVAGWDESEFATLELVRNSAFDIVISPDAPDRISLRYTITDGLADPVSGVIRVAVSDRNGADQPPVVRRDVVELRPGRTGAVAVLLNDFDPEGGTLRVARHSEVDGVDIRISGNEQEILITLPDDIISGFSFAYEAVDEAGNRAPSFIDVRIVPADSPNRPPTARTDIARTRAGVATTVAVLSNDSDPDGDVVGVESIAAQPAGGSATIGDDGTIVYRPEPGFAGTDRFRYVVVDPFGAAAIGEVLVGVLPDVGENRPPTARDDRFTVLAGADPTQLLVLDNDSDPDSDPITIVATSGGDAIERSDDSLTFIPPAAIERSSVEVTVSYTITDGRGGESSALALIEVVQALQPVAPIANDDVVGPIKEGEQVEVAVLANDSDPDGRLDDLRVTSNDGAGQPGSAPGSLVFTAGQETEVHRYTVTDVDGLTAFAFVTVIAAENLAPETTNGEFTTEYEQPVALSLAPLASDPDGDELFFACCQNTRNGSVAVELSTANQLDVVFTPDPGFAGVAAFALSADDKRGHVVSIPVAVTVLPKENGAPTATDSTIEIEAGTVGSIALAPLADDEDLATGDTLTFSLDDISLAGVSLTGDTVNVVSEIDDAGVTGTVSYTVTDAGGLSASATVSVVIIESSIEAPITQPDTAATTEGVEVTISVLDNDVDFIGDGLTIISAGSTQSVGDVSFDANAGTVSFLAVAGFSGTANLLYRVQDARATDAGQSSGTISVDVIGLPGVVPTPVAEADNARATVTWGQPATNGGPVDMFEIVPSVGDPVEVGAVSTATFEPLTNDVPITFEIRAHNEAGWGPYSEPSEPVTPDTTPGRPGAPTIEFGDEELIVTWSEPPNEGSRVSEYILEIGGGSNDPPVDGIGTTTYRWSGLDNGTTYRFRVTAVNAAGNSDSSPWSTSEHPLKEPDAASAITVGRGDRFLTLDWDEPTLNGDPILEYQLEMESDPGNYVPWPTRSYTWADLRNGVAQRYRVRSRNRDVDWSEWSPWSTAVTPCGTPLAAAAPGVTRGDTNVAVTWEEPDDNGCNITGYTVEAVGTNLSRSAGPTASSLTFPGLSNGTSYRFRVFATNSEGDGANSPDSSAVIPAGPPRAPTGLSVDAAIPNDGVSGTLDFAFTKPDNNGAQIIDYDIQVTGGSVENAFMNTAPTATAQNGVRSALAPNTNYGLQVRACNDVGCGPWSTEVSERTFGPPSAPTNFIASESTGLVRWSWNPSGSNDTPGFRYEATWSNPIEPAYIYYPTGTSYNFDFGYNYEPYTGRVRACNALGCSGYSNSATGTIRPAFTVNASIGGFSTECWNYVGTSSGPQGPDCRYIGVNATGLRANTQYSMACILQGQGGETAWGWGVTTTNSAGQLSSSNACSTSWTGRQMRVYLSYRAEWPYEYHNGSPFTFNP